MTKHTHTEAQGLVEVDSAILASVGFIRRVYAPRFFVSSQQRFGATDIKALGASQLLGLGQTVLQLLGKSVLQLYLFRK